MIVVSKRSADEAMAAVERVMNDRRGFHVDELDEETRRDFLEAIVAAALDGALGPVEYQGRDY